MKKITLILALIASCLTYGQSSCATAVAVNTVGTNTVSAYGTEIATTCTGNSDATGSAWYSYTATATGVLNLSSDLPANNNNDTRVNVYTGTCLNLTCAGGSDDVSYPANLATNANINVTAGTTYFIAWDNRWSTTVPFSFTASFTPVTGPPNAVSTPSPVDMATNVAIDPADNNADGSPDNSVPLSWVPDTTGSPATEYDIYYGTDPTMLNNLTAATTYTATSVSITGNLYATTYYWQIVAINGSGSSTSNPIWSFTTAAASGTAPSNATTPTPTDGATMVVIDTADADADGSPDNAVDIAWVQDATGQQPNAYTIRLGDSPTTLQTLTTTFTGMAARFVNQSAGTTYYWQVVPTNNGVEAVNQPIWSYTTAGTASVEDDSINFFTISPNPANSIINIITDENINSVDLYNALGQKVLEDITIINNQINITDVHSGIYFLRATSNLGVQTVQIIKN
ncbi:MULTISPECIES: T9SS type A sorting domain-containing protein [Nonlabens]|uniref:Fibronectin type-III domain-containing protein n=5 Tax=Nonlabens ulvanivorans TaxID=906888 RepID=A0A081D8K3_NONUL|nr:T9SS type A sorting domain-containing protein [Nonlabens ulvanivorans]GAK75249.1 hypothetical protein JCM19296_827 [Nonlabens ulvanivorans]GAL75259.1 hypothetical protein JCM19275_420 [Nonlabens ulvanivorans]